MEDAREFRLTAGESEALEAPPPKERRTAPRAPRLELDPRRIAQALKATPGFDELAARAPDLADWRAWWPLPIATFTVCQKTGTATWLDIWDADHFDGFTDMQRSVADCRAWFSGNGYTFWDSAETKTGRVNAYFRVPTTGRYLCNVQLQSFGGAAQVECLIDSFNFGPLPFNGSISQPHYRDLQAGFHSFRIRQTAGSYFFVGLSVWKV